MGTFYWFQRQSWRVHYEANSKIAQTCFVCVILSILWVHLPPDRYFVQIWIFRYPCALSPISVLSRRFTSLLSCNPILIGMLVFLWQAAEGMAWKLHQYSQVCEPNLADALVYHLFKNSFYIKWPQLLHNTYTIQRNEKIYQMDMHTIVFLYSNILYYNRTFVFIRYGDSMSQGTPRIKLKFGKYILQSLKLDLSFLLCE